MSATNRILPIKLHNYSAYSTKHRAWNETRGSFESPKSEAYSVRAAVRASIFIICVLCASPLHPFDLKIDMLVCAE